MTSTGNASGAGGQGGGGEANSLSPTETKILDLIADHQLAERADISGKRLRFALEKLGIEDSMLGPMLGVLIVATERVRPHDRYKLALWGWVFSKHARRVGELVGAVLAILCDRYEQDTDFKHYTWSDLRERLPSLDESQRYFVEQILEVARLHDGREDAGWKTPWDIEMLWKIKSVDAFLRYRVERANAESETIARMERREHAGFHAFDESADELIDTIWGTSEPPDAPPEPAAPVTAAMPDRNAGSVAGQRETPIDFAIVTALEVEREAVRAIFGLRERVRKDSRYYWRGRFQLPSGEAYELVLAQQPDAANVDAALLTNDIIHHWRPGAALFIGIAGSNSADLRLGDVVVANETYYYERAKVTPAGELPEPKMMPVDATLLNSVQALPAWEGRVSVERPDGTNATPRRHVGVIASGEKVIADEAAKAKIAARHRKILAIEMEAHGFGRAVWQAFEHVRHMVIRGISDNAMPAKDDRWHAYAAAAAAEYAKHLLIHGLLPTRGGDDTRP